MEMVLIARTMRPFGLTGEIKVRPETSFPERHESLKTVFFKKDHKSQPIQLRISKSRLHRNFWFFKFESIRNPEDVRKFSGGMLFIPKEERVELPANQIYISDIIGFTALTADLEHLGEINNVLENPNQEILVIKRKDKQDMLVPWIKEFVLEVNSQKGTAVIDISKLRGIYED